MRANEGKEKFSYQRGTQRARPLTTTIKMPSPFMHHVFGINSPGKVKPHHESQAASSRARVHGVHFVLRWGRNKGVPVG